jgi:hypothetical protein
MDNPMNEVAGRVGDNFEQMRARLDARSRELRASIQRFVDDNPIGAVGIAFGVGYLLSGALFSRTTFKAASIGGRFILGGFLRELAAGVAPDLLGAFFGEREESPREATT